MVKSKVEVIPVIEMNIGADIGNNSTEIAVRNAANEVDYFTQSTVIQYNANRPEDKIIDNEVAAINDLINNLNVKFENKTLNLNAHYSVGSEAIRGNTNVRNMDITVSNKVENEIPLITSISMMAAIAVLKQYETTKTLPERLEAQIKMCTAIPASEFTIAKGKLLESRFKDVHKVTVYVGNNEVEVVVNILECRVTEEGKTAMLALSAAEEDILSIYKETYETPGQPFYDENSNLEIEDLLTSETYHSDIGDGSTEFTYIDGYNPVKSKGIMLGVGHVTSKAIELYKERLNNTAGEVTRQFFMQLLRGNKSKSALAKEAFNITLQAEAIEMFNRMTSHFVTLTNGTAEYLVVHGGGANVYKDEIYMKYVEYAEKAHSKVIWIPEKYATKMNSTGLLVLAENVYNKD